MYKEITLQQPYMGANPYLAIFFSFVHVNPYTVPWLLKFFTSPYAFTKGENSEFDMSLQGVVSANLLDDYFMMCCPFVEICHINQFLLGGNIISVLENALQLNYCPAIVINPHSISAYGNMQLYEHDLLIQGFDSDRGLFLCRDFFPPSYTYSQRPVPYGEFIDAYDKRDTKYNLRFIREKKLSVLPGKSEMNKVLQEVLQNLLNRDFCVNNPYYPLAYQVYNDKTGISLDANKVWFGIEVYGGFLENLGKIPNKFWIMLSDSKKLILYALSQLEDYYSKETVHLYEVILHKLGILLNLNIKYNLTNEDGIIKRMASLLCEVMTLENKAILMALNKG